MPNPSADERSPTIDATFRNGSLTAISVILGFSLSFLVRWSALPGPWSRFDLLSVALITGGILLQIMAVAVLLFTSSLQRRRYDRSIMTFLIGLAIVALGTGFAIAGDIFEGGAGAVVGGSLAPPPGSIELAADA